MNVFIEDPTPVSGQPVIGHSSNHWSSWPAATFGPNHGPCLPVVAPEGMAADELPPESCGASCSCRGSEPADVSPTPPPCTCGATDDRHAITCFTVAWTQPHAMHNLAGEVFYPDSADDARDLARDFDARPMRPDMFPFNLGGGS